MIDTPGRPEERFPPRKEAAVRQRIALQLAKWEIGGGDLAICGAARGTDILFAEVSADRGAEAWLMLPLPEPDFLEQSVRLPDSDWESRYVALGTRPHVRTFHSPGQAGSSGAPASPFARNNRRMVDTAVAEAVTPANLDALLVWDEEPAGDGPGGTTDFADRVRNLGGTVAIINPKQL